MLDFIDYYKLFFNEMSNQGSLVYCLGAHKSPPFAICMWGKHLVLGAPSHLVAKVRRAVGPGWFTRVRVRCLGIGSQCQDQDQDSEWGHWAGGRGGQARVPSFVPLQLIKFERF